MFNQRNTITRTKHLPIYKNITTLLNNHKTTTKLTKSQNYQPNKENINQITKQTASKLKSNS